MLEFILETTLLIQEFFGLNFETGVEYIKISSSREKDENENVW